MKLTLVFEEAEEGGYTCWVEEIPEAISEGDSLEEAKKNLLNALDLVLAYRREQAESHLSSQGNEKIFKKETLKLAIG